MSVLKINPGVFRHHPCDRYHAPALCSHETHAMLLLSSLELSFFASMYELCANDFSSSFVVRKETCPLGGAEMVCSWSVTWEVRPVAHSTWGVRGFRSANPECGSALLRRLCARWLACVRPAASRVTHAAVCGGVNLGPRECARQARSQVRYEYSDMPRACDAYFHRSDGLRGTSSVYDGPPRRPPPRPGRTA